MSAPAADRSTTPFCLRRALPADAEAVYRINNDPAARAQSVQTKPIPWDDHVRWYAKKLEDAATLFLIIEVVREVVGVVRFDEGEPGIAVVSLSLAPESRGRGLSVPVLKKATGDAFRWRQLARVDAFVRPSNEASVRAFTRAGYLPEGRTDEGSVELLRFVACPPWVG